MSDDRKLKSLQQQHEIMVWLQDNLDNIIRGYHLGFNKATRKKLEELQYKVHMWELQDMAASITSELMEYQETLSQYPMVHPSIIQTERPFALDTLEDAAQDLKTLLDHDSYINKNLVGEKMGLILQCLARLSNGLDINLSEVARKNLQKVRGCL